MSGFTLIETLIVILILSFLAMGILGVLTVGDLSWNSGNVWLDLQQEVRVAMDGMTREARGGNISGFVVTADNAQVDFSLPGVSNTISYYLSGTQLMREHPAGTTKVLANDISSVSFCCLGGINCSDCINASSISFNITAEKTVKERSYNYSLVDKVRIRND
jgi:prepilin-type N-terminal cleavage/methylation domain-containing protein